MMGTKKQSTWANPKTINRNCTALTKMKNHTYSGSYTHILHEHSIIGNIRIVLEISFEELYSHVWRDSQCSWTKYSHSQAMCVCDVDIHTNHYIL